MAHVNQSLRTSSFRLPARWPLLLGLLALLLLAAPVTAQDANPVLLLTFDGPVNPILISYLERSIEQAEGLGAAAIILRLDTPGGQVDLTQDIVKMMRSSPVPIIVYVWPSGATAGSAGSFITLAGHAAAMAPGSSIGAASPVAEGGQEIGETLRSKITNILEADIENLARRRGDQAVEWARQAVTEARAATAEQALALGVIDAIAVDVDDLLQQLDGFEVEVNGRNQPLRLAGASVQEQPLTGLEGFLNTIINAIVIPGIAILLIVLGVQAIIGEVSQPGGYVLGIVGAIGLLMGLYALGILNANWVGLGFLALSFVLFLADIKAPTHGVLTASGVATFILGAVILFSGTEVAIPWATIISLAVASALFFSFVVAKALQAQRRRPTWGQESMVGKQAVVRAELNPAGKVMLQGEWWNAELQDEPGPAPIGTEVTVVDRRGFTLLVRRAA